MIVRNKEDVRRKTTRDREGVRTKREGLTVGGSDGGRRRAIRAAASDAARRSRRHLDGCLAARLQDGI